jgi:tRNA G18 (ribose-2'-O)-methylase SpoU
MNPMATLSLHEEIDPDHPDLRPYRSLRRRKDLVRESLFVAEGDKVIQELLRSSYPIESLLITPQWLERIRDLLDRRDDRIQVFLASKPTIEAISGFECYHGIKAVGRITRPPMLGNLLESLPRPWLLCALEGIANAENMGVIVRNASAFGVQALVVGETSCSPFLTRSIRTSMGTVFGMPIVENVPLQDALALLRTQGCRLIAAHPSAEDVNLPEGPLGSDACVIFGSEGFGITPETLTASDLQVSIPMANAVDSLNVSSAAAVIFYEAWRQRQHRSLP